RIEMHNFGVKVCVIEPGYFKTMITNVENLEKNFHASWEKLPADIKASYGESYLRDFVSMLKLLQKGYNTNLSLVTNCMEHALTSLHPRSRYSAGWDAKLLYLPLSYLPSALSDAL
ncbi:RDH2 dehydrogenase, partial [Emberiza fucata]|nr:RDH2 dehydrogenase [Emberiza fucata]